MQAVLSDCESQIFLPLWQVHQQLIFFSFFNDSYLYGKRSFVTLILFNRE